MRVGLVKYLNALPFHIALDLKDLEITFGHPTELNCGLSTKVLDAALTSSVEAFSNSYEILPFGIACEGEVLSVNLYIKNELTDSCRIALTGASATSVALLQILCHHVWQIAPEYVDEKAPHDAKLLIGDEALLSLHIPGYRRLDLSLEWKKATGLPFVFALMMVQKDTPTEDLKNALENSLTWSLQHRDLLLQKACSLTTIPKERLSQYYNSLYYHLEEKEYRSLELFSSLYVQRQPA